MQSTLVAYIHDHAKIVLQSYAVAIHSGCNMPEGSNQIVQKTKPGSLRMFRNRSPRTRWGQEITKSH
jgi:hypothetical protein